LSRKRIRVVLVDDSRIALTVLKRILEKDPDIEIAGAFVNPIEALEQFPNLKPDVACIDFEMPGKNGLELTRAIMSTTPCPILVVSSFVQPEHQKVVFDVLDAGALDVFPKPRGGVDAFAQEEERELIRKVRLLSGIVPFRRKQWPASNRSVESEARNRIRIVAIGASTGGPVALQSILRTLPADFPVPILCVQHISEGFLDGMITWLKGHCALDVRIARAGEVPAAGTVYFAGLGTHLLMEDGKIALSQDPPVHGHRPSVSLLFKSVAASFGKAAIAVLLTGMGSDGADGLKSVQDAGGVTVAQNEESSVVFGMPGQAVKLGAVRHVLGLEEIPNFLIESCRNL
jgi:two-component system chemotaxis response regulator CheB